MRVIGIAGPRTSGKSTFAKMLQDSFINKGERCVIIPFAKKLKEFAIELGWNGKKDERGVKLLQMLGTDICRDLINSNIWVLRWFDEAVLTESGTIIIADDVRFNNEANVIREMDGVILEMVNRSFYKADHTSEIGVNPALIDLQVNNGDGFDELRFKAKRFVEEYQ